MRLLSLLLVAMGLVAAGWQWSMRHRDRRPNTSVPPIVEDLLRDAIARDARLCIAAGPFPLAINDDRSDKSCERCEDLLDAGLITKTGGDQTSVATYFHLTEAGHRVYVPAGDPRLPQRMNESAFCFGKPVLYRIDKTLPPMRTGLGLMIGIRFTTQVVSPDPLLFEANGKVLRLPVPSQHDPALLPPQIITAIMSPDRQRAYLDPDIRYGEFTRP